MDDGVPTLLITANVGSLFEDPERLLNPWISEFLSTISNCSPKFFALHLQEVGGKTYEKSMKSVQDFIRQLCEASEFQEFNIVRIFMDEDFSSAEHFTALGNLYFVHQTLEKAKIWNFLTHEWEIATDKKIFSGNIESIATKEKAKFPQHFFPECKWSRKGYMRVRWEIQGTVFDLVNIHLFHDASNLAACEEFPSVYCKTRRRALVHTLEKFHIDDKNVQVPYFLFGDFNFRCDTEGVIKELTTNLTVHRIQSIKNDSTKVHYRNSLGNNVLTVGKKEFNHADHQLKFKEPWLKKFDRELEVLNEVLVEYPIEFPPSYPYEEDPEMPTDYMSTRCPAWCDRILMSPQGREIILDDNAETMYGIMGKNICMGDHKPIFLKIRLKRNQGTYRCCKCYDLKANNNYSESDQTTSHHNVSRSSYKKFYNDYCPYRSRIYDEILFECNDLNNVKCESTNLLLPRVIKTHFDFQNSNMTNHEFFKEKCPISINIIDSDNICVCMCSQLALTNNFADAEGTICPQCENIIRKRHYECRYKLISNRLELSDNIIVNRIDTQHLNINIDLNEQHDPYTPESTDSHSPCSELNNTFSPQTNVTRSRIPYKEVLKNDEQSLGSKLIKTTEFQNADCECQLVLSQQIICENHLRGIVTPGQLKSRLEDLQRSSLLTSDNRTNEVENSDVDNVMEIHHSCLPTCCNIQ